MTNPRTYSFKTIAGCEIKADVWSAAGAAPRPTIMWIHGGALIMGDRGSLPERQRARYLEAGFSVVSIDYRLAPETKLEEIIEDVGDAFGWVREHAAELNLDASRMATIGHSAGGYLTLMSGFSVSPSPKALVSFYGYGDIIGDWYSRPDPFYCQEPPVPKEEAYQSVGRVPISGSPGENRRFRFYLYCRQQGLWPKEVAGHDPETDPDFFRQFCPVRNITPAYPPTLLLHGDKDTDVPYQQSVEMAEGLARAGVEHELITIPGGGHGFDSSDSPEAEQAFARVIAFLKKHLV